MVELSLVYPNLLFLSIYYIILSYIYILALLQILEDSNSLTSNYTHIQLLQVKANHDHTNGEWDE